MPQSQAKWPGRLQVAFLLTEGNRWEIAPFPNSGVRRPRAAAGAGKQLLPRERTWGAQGELDTAGGPSLHLRRAGGTPAPETGPRSSEGSAVASRCRPPTQPRPRGGLDAAVKGKRRGGGPGPSPAIPLSLARVRWSWVPAWEVTALLVARSIRASRCSVSDPGGVELLVRIALPQPASRAWPGPAARNALNTAGRQAREGRQDKRRTDTPVRPRWRAESGCRDDCRPATRQDSNTETRVAWRCWSGPPQSRAGGRVTGHWTDRLSNQSAKGPPLPPGIQVCPSPEGEGGVTLPQRLADICISRKQNPPSKPGARHLHFKGWLVSPVRVGAGLEGQLPISCLGTRMAARNYLGSAILLHANMLFFNFLYFFIVKILYRGVTITWERNSTQWAENETIYVAKQESSTWAENETIYVAKQESSTFAST
ncbi:uncharacterized protein LOC122110486 [Dipodomys spectabilis]|uniref:uncharacterized protein LOC122110486 n=1 Tax=Dipodomys spectabilis TaxID=105255 RepID=UPI001C54A478|nr:uncharacterized protein LOC122110486 [Dipodomys spectabilis]